MNFYSVASVAMGISGTIVVFATYKHFTEDKPGSYVQRIIVYGTTCFGILPMTLPIYLYSMLSGNKFSAQIEFTKTTVTEEKKE